ncbi:MAG: hypothetical protein HQK54_10665 [Oligoflexales bacterium]|nr:hypothetical protein [Oligoflexales bacterium]
MAGVFEKATRSAIEEIILSHCNESKFGYLLTKESFEELRDEIYDFFVTSRNLKAAGDRLLSNGFPGADTGKTKNGIKL